MPRGFIQDPLQLKLLILYVLDHLVLPVTPSQLTDLVLCDDGVDYFQYSEALGDLLSTGHVAEENGTYTITPKGRKNCEVCENIVPYSVRVKCDRHTGTLNAVLRRNSQVKATVFPRSKEEYTVRLSLSDNEGDVISMDLLSGSEDQSKRMCENFKAHAEEIYNTILTALLTDYGQKDDGDEAL